MEVFVLLMVTSLGVMGIITRTVLARPNLLRQRLPADQDYWRLGTIFGAIFWPPHLLIGYPWMSMMF